MHKAAMLWVVVLVLLSLHSLLQAIRHPDIQTDVLSILAKDDPATSTLRQLSSSGLGRSALFLVGHENQHAAAVATHSLGRWMKDSGLFESVDFTYGDLPLAYFDLYFGHRYHILSPGIRAYLEKPDGYKVLLERLTRTLYRPTSSVVTRFIAQDPLLFFPALVQNLRHKSLLLELEDGLLGRHYEHRQYYVINATFASDPYDPRQYALFEEQWQSWHSLLAGDNDGIVLLHTSLARFASRTRNSIHSDIALIGVGSIIGVGLLTFATFRTFKHLLIGLIPIAVGIWIAVGVCLLFFGELHALTLAFGASLIGVCIDYSFHFFAYHRVSKRWRPIKTMSEILPALSLAALTTLISYLGLAFTPLPLLKQMAVFASCGIVVSFITVATCFPVLLAAPHPHAEQPPLLYRYIQQAFASGRRYHKLLIALWVFVLASCLPGLFSLKINDSPQALNTLPVDIVADDRRVRRIVGVPAVQRYLIVDGRTSEDSLQTLEHLSETLFSGTVAPVADLGPVLTSFLPSIQMQDENWKTAQGLLSYEREVTMELAQLGFGASTIQRFFHTLRSRQPDFLSPETWLKHEASVGLRHLWLGQSSRGTAILVPVVHVHDEHGLRAMVSSIDGIQYVDQVNDLARALKGYRQQAIRLAGGAYCLVFLLLIWRYGTGGVVLLLPPLLSAVATVGALGLLGQPFHIIHCLSLLLVLGIGVDYTIFAAEFPKGKGPTTCLAMILSALTTLLSFGMLSLSHQAVLHALGLTTLIGVALVLLFVPIVLYRRT